MEKILGKIILVDNVRVEMELLNRALNKLPWNIQIEYFENPNEALEYLKKTKELIFLIISDFHMPQMTGFRLKQLIDNDQKLREKAIPFIYYSSSSNDIEIDDAYAGNIQGFFKKPNSPKEATELLDMIIKYWITCIRPIFKKNGN